LGLPKIQIDRTFMKAHQVYLRFLNVMKAIEADGELPQMDLECRRLLEEVAVRQHEGQSLTVTEAMALADIASPATLHRKLDQLLQLGMVEHQFEGDNRRTKYLVCTEASMRYFDRAGRAMQRSLKVAG
jgi:DNA-binding MarR family transcriptional regulator